MNLIVYLDHYSKFKQVKDDGFVNFNILMILLLSHEDKLTIALTLPIPYCLDEREKT